MDLHEDYSKGYRDNRSRSPVNRGDNRTHPTTADHQNHGYNRHVGERSCSPNSAPQQSQQQQKQPEESVPGTVVFVTGLSSRTVKADLEAIFAKHGGLTKVSVICDPHTRESRGFAFVNFEQPSDAEVAIRNVNGTEMDGRMIKAELAKRRRPRTPTPGRYFGEKRGPDPRANPYSRERPIPNYRDAYRDSLHYDRGDRGGRGGYSPPPAPYPRYNDRYPPAREPYPRSGYERRSPPPPPRDRMYDRRSPPRHPYPSGTSTGMHYEPQPRPRY